MSKYIILRKETDVKTIYGILIFPRSTPREEREVDYISIINDAKMQAMREFGDEWIIRDIVKILQDKYPTWDIVFADETVDLMMI